MIATSPSSHPLSIAVIGTGPAGLMAADTLAAAGHPVTLYDKRKAPGWKLYIAGSSGLNITNSLPLDTFAQHYTGPQEHWQEVLQAMGPKAWIDFIEQRLALGTFLGTSGRYFVETMHAAKLIKNWRKRLESLGVHFILGAECSDWQETPQGTVQLSWADQSTSEHQAVIFALGGGSYASPEEPVRWPELFIRQGIGFESFEPSNTGYALDWPEAFLAEADGAPLKNIELHTARGSRKGDLVVTRYGLEGTPIYFIGCQGTASLDLKPDMTEEALLQKLQASRENKSPLRRAQKYLKLCPASQALLFHLAPAEAKASLPALAALIKNFPLHLQEARPLTESISSRGGIPWSALDATLSLKSHPLVFCAGEMIAWDAPTGGFLIQGAVAQGYWAATQVLTQLRPMPKLV